MLRVEFDSVASENSSNTKLNLKGQPNKPEGGICPTLNLSDTEVLRQIRVSLGWVLSDNFRAGQFPAPQT